MMPVLHILPPHRIHKITPTKYDPTAIYGVKTAFCTETYVQVGKYIERDNQMCYKFLQVYILINPGLHKGSVI